MMVLFSRLSHRMSYQTRSKSLLNYPSLESIPCWFPAQLPAHTLITRLMISHCMIYVKRNQVRKLSSITYVNKKRELLRMPKQTMISALNSSSTPHSQDQGRPNRYKWKVSYPKFSNCSRMSQVFNLSPFSSFVHSSFLVFDKMWQKAK